MQLKHFDFKKFLFSSLIIAYATGLQVQILFAASDDYMGLRINLGDACLPIAGLIIIASLLVGKTSFPHWSLRYNHSLPILMTVAIAYGLFCAYYNFGDVGIWALINRGVGWLILMSHFYFAAWLFLNSEKDNKEIFLVAFVWFFSAVLVLGSCWYLFMESTQYHSAAKYEYSQFSGLMGNRNAYIFLVIAGVTLCYFLNNTKKRFFPDWLLRLVIFFLPIAAVFNGSRAGWICILLLLIYFAFRSFRKFLHIILPSLILAGILLFSFYNINPDYIEREKSIFKNTTSL